MPYRRLPNTDQARIRALRSAVEQGEMAGFMCLPYSYGLQNEASRLLLLMEKAFQEYEIALERQVSLGREYANHQKTARLYVSHFIQVLNMCIARGEMKPEVRAFYGLPDDSMAVPDLSTEQALKIWGKNIIKGEQARIQHGGTPIYNPSIAKVTVYYEIFTDAQTAQKIYQNNTRRAALSLDHMHEQVDAVILDIWNQVENYYKDLEPDQRREACRKYGLCYYYRKGEARPKDEPDSDADEGADVGTGSAVDAEAGSSAAQTGSVAGAL